MITETDGIALARKAAWHGLGTVLDQDYMTTQEAITAAGLEWTVEQHPITTTVEGVPVAVESHVANVRSDTGTVLGVVGSGYVPTQNTEAFAFVDDLLGGEVQYDVAGSLKGGKTVWMVAKLDRDLLVAGDQDERIDPYIVLANGHDGMMSLTVYCTPVRVVCQNTLTWSLRSAQRMWKARHTRNVKSKVDAARHTLGLASSYFDSLQVLADQLITEKVNDRRRKTWTEKLLPMPENPSDRQRENVLERRDVIQQACKVDNLTNIYGTAWGWVQGVSEYESHWKNYQTDETRMASLTFGYDSISNKALDIAMAGAGLK
jgi:phage/plasmid-like protein (TIGR03299 family)